MSPAKTAILFDLDGTLIDTAPDLLNTLEHILLGENCPLPPREKIRPLISFGARGMIERGLELAGRKESEQRLDQLWQDFLDHYSANIAVDSRPFPGLLAQLDRLQANGHPLGICTNKRENMSRQLISALDMEHYFCAIIGIDTLAFKKPHPGHILGTIKAMNADAKRAVMIGDSENDIVAAQRANIPVIALDFGYSSQPVENFNPDAIISHYDELPTKLSALLQG